MPPANATHNEWLIQRELGGEVHLARERRALPSLLPEDEELLAVASAGFQFGRPGILAITDRRLIHLHFRYVLRSLKAREFSYSLIEAVAAESSGSAAVVTVQVKERRRRIDIPIPAGVGRATELAECARKALGVFEFRTASKAEMRAVTVGSPPSSEPPTPRSRSPRD